MVVFLSTNTNAVESPQLNSGLELFSLDRFPLVFEDEAIPEATKVQIVEDIEGFLVGREYEIVRINDGDSMRLGESGYPLVAVVNYGNPGGQDRYHVPLLLRTMEIDTAFRYLVNVENSERIYISSELSQIYEAQISLKTENQVAFEQLDAIVERLNNLRQEALGVDLYNELFPVLSDGFNPSNQRANNIAESMLVNFYGRYKPVSLLNVVESSEFFARTGGEISDVEFLANVDFTSDTQGNPGYLTSVEIILSYQNEGWKFWLGYGR